jgi:hypothetical protein
MRDFTMNKALAYISAIDFIIPLLASLVAGSARQAVKPVRSRMDLHRPLIDLWQARRWASWAKGMDL